MIRVLVDYYNKHRDVKIPALGSKSNAWEEFRHEFVGILKLKAYWLSFAFIGLLISFTGSFDTYFITPIEKRTAFVFAFLLASGLACAVLAGIHRALTGASCLRRLDCVVKIALIWVLIATVPGRLMINYLGDLPLSIMQLVRSGIHGSSIALLITIIMFLLARRRRATKRKLARSNSTTDRAINENKAPSPIEANIRLPYYIESEDHYLKMVYLGKVEFIRANLVDVAAGFASRGLRCHKSYWVSRSAIERRRRQGRQLLLVLKDGTEIPVGRSFEKEVRAMLDTGPKLDLVR